MPRALHIVTPAAPTSPVWSAVWWTASVAIPAAAALPGAMWRAAPAYAPIIGGAVACYLAGPIPALAAAAIIASH